MKTRQNRLLKPLALLLALALSLGTLAALAQGSLSSDEIKALVETTTDKALVTSPFIEIAGKAQQSVVGVNNYQTSRRNQYGNSFGFPYQDSQEGEVHTGTGSGTVISPYGHVLTNYHVIEDASRVTVTLGEDELDATIVGADHDLDIAVLLVPGLDLPAAPLGDSDQIQVGEYAIVIGNPLGQQFERSVTIGVVSAVSRTMSSTSRDRYGLRTRTENQMIQVDAAISSGNSGGGLFNTLGQLQGIPTMKLVDNQGGFFSSTYSIDNIGMCIPINAAKPLIQKVLEEYNAEDVKAREEQANTPKPRIGVRVGTVSNYLADNNGLVPQGALVAMVEENSPAQAAGLLAGDIIVEADGNLITTQTDLISHLQAMQAGDKVKLKVYRVSGLLEALEKFDISSLGEGEYLDLEVELKILNDTQM